MTNTDIYNGLLDTMDKETYHKSMIHKIQEIRPNPRKMREDYLHMVGVYDYIFEETAGDEFIKFNIRERMDFILAGKPDLRCHCGNRIKIGATNCSAKCTGNNPVNVAKMSQVQKSNSKERWEKTQETNLKKYGVYHNNHIESCKEARKEKRKLWSEKTIAETFAKYGLDINNYNSKEKLEKVIEAHSSLEEISQLFNGMPVMTVYRHMLRYDVKMYHKQTSGGEREICSFVESLGVEIKTNDRLIIKPYELDVVIPEKKIAIEFDGIYWHSEKAARGEFDPKWHLKKTQMCDKAGYQLIHIFENDWKLKKEICKSIIAAKLGIFREKIHARKCEVVLVPHNESKEFFERTHIQGYAQAKVTIGLKIDNKLIMACSFGKPRFSTESDWELIRFSSELNLTVIGGFGKILSHFKKNYPGTLLTYCDMKYSNGSTYSKFGKLIRQTEPGYSWCSLQNPPLSRYQTQKHKLEKIFPNSYSNDKTENQILSENGYYKLYDCGNLVYQLQ
jgi:G:T-mismatch repair DNA endonuclease (very short patch repair protein)